MAKKYVYFFGKGGAEGLRTSDCKEVLETAKRTGNLQPRRNRFRGLLAPEAGEHRWG